jgi:hypothetical protein
MITTLTVVGAIAGATVLATFGRQYANHQRIRARVQRVLQERT